VLLPDEDVDEDVDDDVEDVELLLEEVPEPDSFFADDPSDDPLLPDEAPARLSVR
jgi:hypothetical protein